MPRWLTRMGLAALTLTVGFHWGYTQEPSRIAHWPLGTDARNAISGSPDGVAESVSWNAPGPHANTRAASFNGRDSAIVVPDSSRLQLKDDPFTISLWVHPEDADGRDPGDLVSCYDPATRRGWSLTLRTNTGSPTSQANTRQLQFGIDAGTKPEFHDLGRPGNATLGFALAVHDGALYVGTAENGPGARGHVYRHDQGQTWIDCGTPDASNAVSALAEFNGKLYAATAKYRFAGSALAESPNQHPGGRVFRYEGEQRWVEVGHLPDCEAISGLVVYKGQLYASALYRPAGFFRMDAENRWTPLPVPDGKRVNALTVSQGAIWASSYDGGHIYRFDGSWQDMGLLGENTQTYSFATHRGQLCVGTWPSGKVYTWNGTEWQDIGQLGMEKEVMGMLVHNGQLYAGTLPLAEIHRRDATGWTRLHQLDTTPEVMYRRVWAMAQYRGRLIASTLPSGHIHALQAGVCVTHDRTLSAGWHHIAAVRTEDRLLLYVDGERVAESDQRIPKDLDLTTRAPLRIGVGEGSRFTGHLADLRIDKRALGEQEIRGLARR